jgi:hypothetical protein
MKATGINNLNQTYDITSCEYLKKVGGYSDHACIADNPRLFNEVPRGGPNGTMTSNAADLLLKEPTAPSRRHCIFLKSLLYPENRIKRTP